MQYILEVESDDKSIRLDYEFLKKDIKYRYKGKTHYYIPDFIIQYTDGSTYLIEVKPKDLVKDIINQKKFKAARKYCKKHHLGFKIWTGEGELIE